MKLLDSRVSEELYTGPPFVHPHPGHLKNTLLGWGAYEEGGAYKLPAAGASKYTVHPLP